MRRLFRIIPIVCLAALSLSAQVVKTMPKFQPDESQPPAPPAAQAPAAPKPPAAPAGTAVPVAPGTPAAPGANGAAAAPATQAAAPATQAAAPPGRLADTGALQMDNVSLTEMINLIGHMLKINFILGPRRERADPE